MGELCWKIWAP
jgi:hypothetical protein